MQTDFNRIRSAGAKVICRFTYTSSSSYTVFQPTKAKILQHMKQLVYVLNANKDVIVSIQAGFIGKYGEWYYTGSSEFGDGDYTILTTTQWNNRKQIMDYMINNFPVEVPLQLRYVYAKQKMYGNSYVGRIGFYNDAFLGTYGDSGTFLVNGSQSQPSVSDISYWQNNTINNPVTGETNQINTPRTNCSNAMIEMDKYNWSLINKDYYPDVISNWQTNNCFATIQKSLGYDFRLNSSTLINNTIYINIANYGYANLFRDRKAYLVCKNINTNTNYSFLLYENIKNINIVNTTLSMNLLGLSLPIGTYKLYLNLPDNLINNPNYSIRTSNLNTWTSEGFNDLLQTYTVQGLNIINKQIITDEEVRIYDIYGNFISNKKDISALKSGIYVILVNGLVTKISI